MAEAGRPTKVETERRQIDEAHLIRALHDRAPRLRSFVAARIPPELQAAIEPEDVLQEVWIKAFQHLPGMWMDGKDAVDRWLTCIAQNTLLNAVKAAGRKKRGGGRQTLRGDPNRSSSYLDLFARVASPGRTPSSEAAVAEAVDAVQVALASLPPARQRAVRMRYIEGKPQQAIAQEMNRTEEAINALLFHGLRQLQERLGDPAKFLSGARKMRKATKKQ